MQRASNKQMNQIINDKWTINKQTNRQVSKKIDRRIDKAFFFFFYSFFKWNSATLINSAPRLYKFAHIGHEIRYIETDCIERNLITLITHFISSMISIIKHYATINP